MKKISIFLSTLMLLTGVNTVIWVNDAMAEGELTNSELLGVARSVTKELSGTSEIKITTNSYDGRMWIDEVWPRDETIMVSAKSEDANRGLRRVVLLMMNYRLVSMEQADREWENWDGYSLPYWTLESMEYTTIGPWMEIRQPVWMGMLDLEKENRTNVVYYYAEMGGWNGDEPEILWGKIDYRNCAQDKYVKENPESELICKAEIDAESGELRYVLNERAGDELVPVGTGELVYATWADEFGVILQGDVAEMGDGVADLEALEEITDEQEITALEDRVTEVRARLSEVSNAKVLGEKLDDLETRLATLRKKHFSTEVTGPGEGGNGGGSGDDSDEGDKGDNDGGNSGNGGNGSGSGSGDENSGLDDGALGNFVDDTKGDSGDSGKDETEDIGAGGDNSGSEGTASTAASNTGGVNYDNGGVAQGDIESIESEPEVDNSINNPMAEASREDETGVEVPNLGGEEVAVWPWIILFLSVAGVAGWWLWRAFGVSRKGVRK